MTISSNSTFSNPLRQDMLFLSRNPMRARFQAKSTSAPEYNARSNFLEAKTNLSALLQVSGIISVSYMEPCHGNCLISFLAQIRDVTTKLRRGFESVGGSTWNICLSRTRSMDRVPRGTSGGRNRTAQCIHGCRIRRQSDCDCSTWNRVWPKVLAHHLVFDVSCVPCGTMWSSIVTKFVQEFFCST